MSRNDTSFTFLRILPALAVFVVMGTLAGAVLAQAPVVNGLFYGDSDDDRYVHWDTSYYGSKLYVFYDAPGTTLHVALVVDRSVNDNVFGASHAGFSGNYMASAGWGQGGGQQRDAAALVNSEYSSFEFACAPNTPNVWEWKQGYGCEQGGTWVSDASCPTSEVLVNGFPPGWSSASSFAWNVNTWNAQGTKPWDMHVFGTALTAWKSPFSESDPNTDPPNNPNTVIGLEGYPAATDSGDLSLGPQITFNDTYQYEWSMVYEWSIDVGEGGTDCGDDPLFLVTGLSHHSPMKAGVEGLYDTECGEENDCFPPGDGDSNPLSDYGDLPDTYGTLEADVGPRHHIKVSGPYLGQTVEIELDGQPTADATGDGDEEDGVAANVDGNWTAGSTQTIDVEVSNVNTGDGQALLGGWFDWNDDGDFADAGEFFSWSVSEGTNTLSLTVGSGFDWQNDSLHARFRIFSSAATAPGGTLTQADSIGTATDGEVEDYVFAPGSLPVTLNAFSSVGASRGQLAVRWQTASETDNVGFELWGLVDEEWRVLHELVPSQDMSSALPQTYEVSVDAPAGLTRLQLVGYDSRGRTDHFGPFRLDSRSGEEQAERRVDWTAPRAERTARLQERGFADVAGEKRGHAVRELAAISGDRPVGAAADPAQWKKTARDVVRGADASASGFRVVTNAARGGSGRGGPGGGAETLLHEGPMTHVAVIEAGIQRVTYEALLDGGLDLAGVHSREIAVTWRGEPVPRWIDGAQVFGPGSAIEFLGHPPRGDDALYVEAAHYQIGVDASRAEDAQRLGKGTARWPSESYLREVLVDRPGQYNSQSPTGDPWVERTFFARDGSPATVTLDLPVDGPVLGGSNHLVVGLGTLTDLAPLRDADGSPLAEHNVEVSLNGLPVAQASTSGQRNWTLDVELPSGALQTGSNQLQLRFSTRYLFSLGVIDHYGVLYPAPYRGPALDFAPDPDAGGYRIDGFESPSVVAYAEQEDGSLYRLDLRTVPSGGGFQAELRAVDAKRFWVTDRPHTPAVFTTEAPGDLLDRPGDLVIIADSSFVGTPALDGYVTQRGAFDPVVIDVEDVYNAAGFGMAVPSAITDYLRARDSVHPFTHVQLVGTDCYDRLSYVSQCLSMIPLPTARIGVTFYSPSQNRLVDLDGDGVADKAIGQFSVRDETELATIVRKGATWETSGSAGTKSALLIAEETDGKHDFLGQVERLRSRIGWPAAEVLDMAGHPNVATARDAMRSALDEGRTISVFSGHSSAVVWAYRSLVTSSTVASWTNFDRPTLMVPLACETTYDVSPNANVLGHQLLFAGDQGAVAISGAVSLSSLKDNESMAEHVLRGLQAGLTLGEAVLAGREALGSAHQTLQDNWITQGDVTTRLEP